MTLAELHEIAIAALDLIQTTFGVCPLRYAGGFGAPHLTNRAVAEGWSVRAHTSHHGPRNECPAGAPQCNSCGWWFDVVEVVKGDSELARAIVALEPVEISARRAAINAMLEDREVEDAS